MMIDVTPPQLEVVRAILRQVVPGCEVRAFGSRVSGTAKPYSDLDLVVRGPARLDLGTLAALREAFQSSDLPFRVDIIDWHAISDSFREVVDRRFDVVEP